MKFILTCQLCRRFLEIVQDDLTFKNTHVLGTVFGHLSGVLRGFNKRTLPKHTSQGSHAHLRVPRTNFRFPEGSPFAREILQHALTGGLPKWVQDSRKLPKLLKIVPNCKVYISFLWKLYKTTKGSKNAPTWYTQSIIAWTLCGHSVL